MGYKFEYEGERSLYGIKNQVVESTKFLFGESPLKECKDIEVNNSCFTYKYPLWYGKNIKVYNCLFENMARSGIWYTNNICVKDTIFDSPKMFRRCNNVKIENTKFNDAQETFWNSKDIKIKKTYVKGDYFMMNSSDCEIEDLTLDGNYFFDGGNNLIIKDSVLNSKDAFWNCHNVTVINCKIIGEYIGWNSSDLTFIDCTIESHQGFCYINNLKLENCMLINTDLSFELCKGIDAKINSKIESIKNPIDGKIVCKGYNELIMDSNIIDPDKTKIIVEKE